MTLNLNGPNEPTDLNFHPHDPNDTLLILNTQKSWRSAKFPPTRNFSEYAKRGRTFRKFYAI
jgi:hypothetical protein